MAGQILASKDGQLDPGAVRRLKPLSQAIQACFNGGITSKEQVSAIVSHIGDGT